MRSHDELVEILEEGASLSAELQQEAAAMLRSDREKLAQFMIRNGFATGHGDTIDDLLFELEWQIKEGRQCCGGYCVPKCRHFDAPGPA